MFELDRDFFLRGLFLAGLAACLISVGAQVRFDPVRPEPAPAEVVARPPNQAAHQAGRATARSRSHGRAAVSLSARHGPLALP